MGLRFLRSTHNASDNCLKDTDRTVTSRLVPLCEDGAVVDALLIRLLEARSAVLADIAPDGAEILVRGDDTGSMQVYRLLLPDGSPTVVTTLNEPVAAARYIPGTQDAVVAVDTGGDENYQLWCVALEGGELRPLVVEPKVKHDLGDVSRDGRLVAFTSTRRNGVDFDVHVLDLQDGASRIVLEDGMNMVESFSPDGRWLTVFRLDGEVAMSGDLLLIDLSSGDARTVVARDGAGTAHATSWYPDSAGFLFSTNSGRDTAAIAHYDIDSASWKYVIERAMGQRGQSQQRRACGARRACGGCDHPVASLRRGDLRARPASCSFPTSAPASPSRSCRDHGSPPTVRVLC